MEILWCRSLHVDAIVASIILTRLCNHILSLTSIYARSIYLKQGHAKIEISARLWCYQSTEAIIHTYIIIIIIIMIVIKIALTFPIFLLLAGYPAIHKLSFKLAQTNLILIQLIRRTISLWTRIP